MRKFIFAISLLISHLTFAQGVIFREGGFDKTFAEAKKQNKILFLEVYLDGCHHCAALAPVLQNEKAIGDIYNANFVSMKVEANSEESKYIQKTKKITYPEFPLFFFFDTTGTLVHQAAPQTEFQNKQDFINEVLKHANEALTPALRTSNYPARFDAGDRDIMFLVNYARNAKALHNLETMKKINDVFGQIFVQPADLESPSGLFILSRFMDDYQNPMAQYFFKNLDRFRALHKPQDVNDAGIGILHQTMYGLRGNTLSSTEMGQIRKEFLRCGLKPEIANGAATLLNEINAHFREKGYTKAAARLSEYSKTYKMPFLDYVYFTRHFNENTPDNSTAASVIDWSKKALLLLTKPEEKNKVEVADLYYEQAVAYLKLNNKIEAKKSAENALKVATVAKAKEEILKKYSDQLASIK